MTWRRPADGPPRRFHPWWEVLTNFSNATWRLTGLVWTDDLATGADAALEWNGIDGRRRAGSVTVGAALALGAGPERSCVGVWRAGRRIACPASTSIDPAATSGQCRDCAAMARSRSIATDTALDDPRDFTVYLAHHGATIKVGITAAERGRARLLEQGALSMLTLSTGTLLPARRCEALLTTALGLPQRVTTSRKRQARHLPDTPAARSEELRELASRVRALDWPPGQHFTDEDPADLTPCYGLPDDGVRPSHALTRVSPGTMVAGTVRCRIGRDLYLTDGDRLILVDTGLLQGWTFTRAPEPSATTADLERLGAPPPESHQDALF
ncbi:DUF2797 domain-containing protein [Myceligenerans pegani]|uniref:DUF2797 domain-containing protein n=1 Tax=Myceligenerans pegani TaxID=2776917 RepID=A0ABR9N145_9MICO|nr:DUF2797 domain-containing protein [Myceligenerans sp. TRM 65318]MBE1876951.1 DUF2797 domain-containing protein [Myceligenerans sp. TRM 65318]MBE3019222.1 DUF2797 domain-containing protein [Myceligenerans sp. TRM 65318]